MFKSISSSILASLLCITTLVSNILSFKLVPIILPDSESYLEFSSNRTSLYPLFLDFLLMFTNSIYIVITVQTTIYLVTYFFLIKIIHDEFKSFLLTLLFGLSIGSNFYLQSFNSSIVSESLVFSVINLIIICLLKIINTARDNVLIKIVFIGVLTGILFGLKPSMITFIPSLFMIFLLFPMTRKLSVSKLAIAFFSPVIFFIIVESTFHKFYHEERSSFLGKLMFGKALLIMTNNEAVFPHNLSKKDTDLLIKVKELVEPIKKLRAERDVGLEFRALMPRIEVFGQYRASPILENRFGLDKENPKQMMRIGTAVIWSNFFLYTKTSLSYFLTFWYVNEVTSPYIFKETKRSLFSGDFIKEIVPKKKSTQINSLSSIAFFIFFIVGSLSLLFSLLSWFLISLAFVKGMKKNSHFHLVLVGSLFFLVQINVLFVAFINVPMARYLMPLFPLFILAILLFCNHFIETFKKYKAKVI